MREILLTNGGVALVDDEDYALLSATNWQRLPGPGTCSYAYRYTRTRPAPGVGFLMHRVIMRPADGQHVDHINGDGLDNRRANLRCCTRVENLRNQRVQQRAGKTSQYKGVYFDKRRGSWIARCGGRGAKNRWLGSFATEEAAARAYDARAITEYGEFARLNFSEVAA